MMIPITTEMSGHIASAPLVNESVDIPDCTVGNTVVASMCEAQAKTDLEKVGVRGASVTAFPQVNVEQLILFVTKQVCLGLGASASVVQLVESLVWPFVARRSCRQELFSEKELQRFICSLRKSAQRIHRFTNEENAEQSYMKYWLDTLLCQVFRDDQRPDPIFEDGIRTPLFSGWCKRCLARAVARRDVSFIYSLQKGSKRFWPELSELKKEAALKKHADRLSQVKGSVPSQLRKKIGEVSTRILRNRIRPSEMTKFMPSGSACLQASRREGGALSLVDRFTMPLSSVEASKIGKLPVLNANLNRWRREQFASVYSQAVYRTTQMENDHLLADRVEVVPIPEPSKFRIISLGDGYLYTALQPLQGAMLDAWKKSYASTMLDDDLTDRVQTMDSAVDAPLWRSVDYEAATDLLKRDATLAAFSALEGLPFFDLGWMSLLVGRAEYPDGSQIDTLEGQLMGHPLSFPLLCVINLSVYLHAIDAWVEAARALPWREWVRRRKLAEKMRRNVLVNGDDMLFKCDESFLPFFRASSSSVGFKSSAGKDYASPDCCMINSQLFRRVNGKMRRFGYLNLKIIKGFSLKSGESEAVPTQIGRDLSKMAKLAPWTASCIPAAFQKWKQDWFGKYYHPNWYLPVHLGGFGVDADLAPPKCHITREQRLMAARFVSDPRMALYRRRGMDLPTSEMAGSLAHWRMIPGDYVPREGESTEVVDSWLARLAYASRAHSGSAPVADAVFISRFRPEYRLKPMSFERLGAYWRAQLFASRLPPCPPLNSFTFLADDVGYRPKVWSMPRVNESLEVPAPSLIRTVAN